MRHVLKPMLVVIVLQFASASMAQEYVTIDMENDINKPAAEVWEKVSDHRIK
jgi:hypothetical protein|tara:strand:+ start:249 stop:404 length:156 start_codon:yes stop_codon:yes gene_type:complete